MRIRLLGLMLAAVQAPAGAGAETSPELPGWMAGCWAERSGERLTEECWMGPRGGVMLGAGRSGIGERVTDAENMRIETDLSLGGAPAIRLAFRAAQRDGTWTTFAWSPSAEPGVTFANAGHDYPQRIRYWREGASLMAEIAMLDGSKAKRWTYVRAGP